MNTTTELYSRAVSILYPLAMTDTSSARAAAQVLLSAYNGHEFQLDITDLMLLDTDYYTAALHVISGRVQLRIEPHEVIIDGDKKFKALADSWHSYSITQRKKM